MYFLMVCKFSPLFSTCLRVLWNIIFLSLDVELVFSDEIIVVFEWDETEQVSRVKQLVIGIFVHDVGRKIPRHEHTPFTLSSSTPSFSSSRFGILVYAEYIFVTDFHVLISVLGIALFSFFFLHHNLAFSLFFFSSPSRACIHLSVT